MASTIVPTTLNPLPDSVLISSARFTASLVAVITPDETLNTSPVWFGASGDLTGDGYPEVMLTGWGSYAGPASPAQPVYLLSTHASGTTVIDAADYLGLGSITGTSAPRIADLDNNGLGDFFFLPYGENPFDPQTPYVVRQVAPGEFETVAIAGPDMISHSSTEGDFNGDGFLDLIAVGARMDMGYFPGAFFESAALLYLGDGQGGFTPYAMAFDQPAGDVRTGDVQFLGGSSAAFADFDNDGDTEIVFSDAASFQNGIPTDGPLRGDILLVSDIQFGAREAWGNVRTIAIPYFDAHPEYEEYDSFLGDQKSHDIKTVTIDVDNDGLLDILVCGLIWSPEGRNLGGVLQVLRNKGSLEFEDITDTSLCNFFLGKSAGHELRLVDVNADGFVDIYMPEIGNEIYSGANPGTEYQTWANQLLINTGEGRFVQAMWNEFNELSQLESALLEPPLGMGPARNWKFNLYVLPDGRIGFIKHEDVGSEDGTVLALFDFRADEVLSTGPGGSDPALQGAPGFSEYYYLTHYPAVAAAVQGGAYENGLEHYLEVGRTQGLFAFAPNAILHGAGGDDLIEAREGNETIIASSGNDTVDGGAGF
ncbi:MAG TPA: FG-GAP-like repeat-containing protein, partial [Ramlibacter sp.]|nr:FG-GAP-like repeat-containing protein [Ramlibacter sp.]